MQFEKVERCYGVAPPQNRISKSSKSIWRITYSSYGISHHLEKKYMLAFMMIAYG